MRLFSRQIQTPVGTMTAWAGDAGICLFDFEHRRMLPEIQQRILSQYGAATVEEGSHPHLDLLTLQVTEYFGGTRKTFDLPLSPAGSDFQRRVWQGLQEIPYGRVSTYLKQALSLGNEKAIRAVAAANGANGIAIIIPCHRVIGSNGSLTGYGGGLHRKQWLLDHERKHTATLYQQQLF